MDEARRRGWILLALDCPVDAATPIGEALASMSAVFGQLERRLISQRTKDALAVKRAQEVKLGRPGRRRNTSSRGFGVSAGRACR